MGGVEAAGYELTASGDENLLTLLVRGRVEVGNAQELKKRFQVKSLPTILIFNSRCKLLERKEESITPDKLLRLLDKLNTEPNRSPVTYPDQLALNYPSYHGAIRSSRISR